MNNIIYLKNLTRAYMTANKTTYALKNINLEIAEGEFVTIIGKSGSGKSTLLNLLSNIDQATSGKITINGSTLEKKDENSTSIWRGKNIGIIFQFFQLLPTLTVLENVMLPMDLVNVIPRKKRLSRAKKLLSKVGMNDHINKFPFELSGGEQQRCAIVRALSNNAPILLADEPTGNLDSKNAAIIIDLLGSLKKEGKTILLVTHEREVIPYSDRSLELMDGEIISNKYDRRH